MAEISKNHIFEYIRINMQNEKQALVEFNVYFRFYMTRMFPRIPENIRKINVTFNVRI